MKSIKTARMSYSAAKFVLAIGTAILAFTIGAGMVENQIISVFLGLFIAAVALAIFDGGFDYLEDVGRAENGQDAPMQKPARILYYVLGISGVIGSMFLSIMAAGMFAGAVTDDRSGIVDQMQKTATQADATYSLQLKTANANLADAKKRLADAQQTASVARQTAIDAIGGDFARQMNAGNAWVRTAPETAGMRRKVAKAEQAAAKIVQSAQADVAQAQKTVDELLRTGKTASVASIAPVLQAQQQVLDVWVSNIHTAKNLFIRADIIAGVFALIFYLFLRISRALPDDKTIIEQLFRVMSLTADAFVFALDKSVSAAEDAVGGRMNIVAHPLPIPQTFPPVAPQNIAPSVAPAMPAQQLENTGSFVAPVQQKAQQPKRNTGATKSPEYLSARSAIRNARTAIKKAQQAYEDGAIDADQLGAIIATKQAAISRNERRAAHIKNGKK